MSDFFRRASDAFHHRPRQDSTDSTGASSTPNAAKSPEEPLKQRSGSAQSDSYADEALAGVATNDPAQKQRHPWGWRHHQGNVNSKAPNAKPEQQSGQAAKKDDMDWVVAS